MGQKAMRPMADPAGCPRKLARHPKRRPAVSPQELAPRAQTPFGPEGASRRFYLAKFFRTSLGRRASSRGGMPLQVSRRRGLCPRERIPAASRAQHKMIARTSSRGDRGCQELSRLLAKLQLIRLAGGQIMPRSAQTSFHRGKITTLLEALQLIWFSANLISCKVSNFLRLRWEWRPFYLSNGIFLKQPQPN